MSDQTPESDSPRATLNDVALLLGGVAGLLWLPVCGLGYVSIAFEYPGVPPAGVYCAHGVASAFTVIGGLTGALASDPARNGLNGWICAIGLVLAAVIPLQALALLGYPSRGPHEWITLGVLGLSSTLMGIAFLRWRIASRPAVRYAGVTLVVAAALSAITAPGVLERNLDTHLPLWVYVERGRAADIQDYAHFSVEARSVSLRQAERYATRVGLSEGGDPAACSREPSSVTAVWGRDERTRMDDSLRYPSGYSGCRVTACWSESVLRVVDDCDWGV